MLAGFAAALLIPSTGTIQKYLGSVGVIVYILLGVVAILISYRYILPVFLLKITKRQALYLAIITFVGLIVVFIVVFPIANSGVVGGGSDRDEAIDIARTALLHGHYPYYSKTYLGNPITPMPGALLLSIPFVLFGHSASQNIFWLFAFFVAVSSYLKDIRKALVLLWIIVILSPIVLHEMVTGGDLLSNSLYVLIFSWFFISSVPNDKFACWMKISSAILLGIGFSSRMNFILISPLIFSVLVQQAGWKTAIKYSALTALAFGLVTIPFYLYDPAGFTPLHTIRKLSQFNSVLPFADTIISLSCGVWALVLSFQRMQLAKFFRNCAIILAIPVICGLVLSTIKSQELDLTFSGFGLSFLFFAALSCWLSVKWEMLDKPSET